MRLEGTRRAGGAGPGAEPRARLAHARGGAHACGGGGGLEPGAGLARARAGGALKIARDTSSALLGLEPVDLDFSQIHD